MLKPIFHAPDNPDITQAYETISSSLNLPHVPLYFAYFGNFPEYLTYITDQIVRNINDQRFQDMMAKEISLQFDMITSVVNHSDKIKKWRSRNKYSPSYIQFQQNIQDIFLTNAILAHMFVALREAVKGWAVAARKLPSSTSSSKKKKDTDSHPHISKDMFIFGISHNIYSYEKGMSNSQSSTKESDNLQIEISASDREQAVYFANNNSIEKDLLTEYLHMCRMDFSAGMKLGDFWVARVNVEERILQQIHNMPFPIVSPINVLFDYIGDKKGYREFISLLSDHFPTYSVQRYMFSGYMFD